VRARTRNDPIHTVCFDKVGRPRQLSSKKQKGHPCEQWTKRLLIQVSKDFEVLPPLNVKKLLPITEGSEWGKHVRAPTRPHTAPPRQTHSTQVGPLALFFFVVKQTSWFLSPAVTCGPFRRGSYANYMPTICQPICQLICQLYANSTSIDKMSGDDFLPNE
jgi:hypothetical protein